MMLLLYTEGTAFTRIITTPPLRSVNIHIKHYYDLNSSSQDILLGTKMTNQFLGFTTRWNKM